LVGNDVQKAIHRDEGNLVGGKYERGVVGEYSVISGGEDSITSRAVLSQTAGLELTMTSGFKWEAGVSPVLPFVFASLAVGGVRQRVAAAFPAGPPDLMAILQQQAAQLGWKPGMGLPPGVSWVAAIPADAQGDIENLLTDFKGLFLGVLQPILK